MTEKVVICQNYVHFANKLRSVIVSQNHYLNKILDVHPLGHSNIFRIGMKILFNKTQLQNI